MLSPCGRRDDPLRHLGAAWRRVTGQPTRLGGVDLPEGAKLFVWLTAVDRDPTVFANPEQFDLYRGDAQRALAFGKGIHYCIGAPLGNRSSVGTSFRIVTLP